MPDGELILDPERAYRAAVDLANAGKAIQDLRTSLGGEISADSAARPWGGDDIGAAFEKNYRGFEQSVLSAWQHVGSYVEGLGANAAYAVVASVETDLAAGRRIDGIGA